jgi:hypothetical protein
MSTTNQLICGLTAEQIEALKSSNGFIFQVTVSDGENEFNAICKEPTMDIMQASQAIGKNDELKSSMVLFDNCVLAADPSIKERFLLKVQVIKALGERMNSLSVTSKNL